MTSPTVTSIESHVAVVDLAPDVSVSLVSSPVAVLDAESGVLVSSPSSTVAVSASQSPVSVAATSVTVAVGVAGIANTAASDLTYPASVPISGQRVVLYDPVAAGWIYADRTVSAHAGATVAVSTAAIQAGAVGAARLSGVLDEPTWNWPAPCTLWLDLAGHLTEAPPESGFLREIARAITPSRIIIEPEPAIALG